MLQLPQDPDLLDSGGRTAFMKAAVKGHVDVLRLLMEAGGELKNILIRWVYKAHSSSLVH